MISILWIDDEIKLLKPHIIYLEEKGYSVTDVDNGIDALDILDDQNFDLVFLDENMPGLSGLETLSLIKKKKPNLSVIMITKNEEESIMEEAIGSKISDYLIKPVNPNQILLSIKKNIDTKRLVEQKVIRDYQGKFNDLSMSISNSSTTDDWIDIYKRIIYWELELDKSENSSISDIICMQKNEANAQFFKFIKNNYLDWVNGKSPPLLSHNIFREKVLPILDQNIPTYFILIDNLRYDQWKILEPLMLDYFDIINDDIYYSILPTSTQYSRNSIFSGLLPSEIQERFGDKWKSEDDEGGKNLFEKDFLLD